MHSIKYIILSIIFVLTTGELLISSEKDSRALIDNSSSLFVQDNNAIWIYTRAGDLYKSKSYGENFIKIDYSSDLDSLKEIHRSIGLKRIVFSGDSILLIRRIYLNRNNWLIDNFLSIDNGFDWRKVNENEIAKLKVADSESDSWYKDSNGVYDYLHNLNLNNKLVIIKESNLFYVNSKNELKFLTDHFFDCIINIDSNKTEFYFINQESTLYRFKNEKLDSTYLFTNSVDISPPKEIKTYGNQKWGFNGQHLYYTTNSSDKWFRQDVFDIDIDDIHMLDSNNLILWDGKKNNYKYTISDKSLVEYSYNTNFIESFFNYELTELNIYSGYSSCMSSQKSSVNFESEGENFQSYEYKINELFEDDTLISFKRKISKDSITNVLKNGLLKKIIKINISDFKDSITVNKFKEARELAYNHKYFRSKLTIEKHREIDQNFISRLDTISQEFVDFILSYEIEPYPLLGSWFVFKLKNSNNDSLIIRTSEQSTHNPYNLPWLVMYNSMYNLTSNSDLTKLFAILVPDKFYNIDSTKQNLLLSLYYKLNEIEQFEENFITR